MLPHTHLDQGLQIDRHPRFFADLADTDFDLSEWRLDRGDPIFVRDGGGPASHEPAPAHRDPLARPHPPVTSADDYCEETLEENVIFKRRPVVHCAPSLACLLTEPKRSHHTETHVAHHSDPCRWSVNGNLLCLQFRVGVTKVGGDFGHFVNRPGFQPQRGCSLSPG